MFGVVVGGGMIATPFFLSLVGDDWRTVVRVFGILFVGLTLLWLVIGRDRPMDEQRGGSVSGELELLKRAFSYRDLWIAGMGFVGPLLAWSSFMSFFPTLLLDTYGSSLERSGQILAVLILVGGIAGVGFGYLSIEMGRGRRILQALGPPMAVTYLGMAITGSFPMLMLLSFVNGIAWGFYPILHVVPFHLPGIRPREVTVAVALVMTISSGGMALGPMFTGFLQETLGSLKSALVVMSFAPLSIMAAGVMLRSGRESSRVSGKLGVA